jgi:hypothetical protein
MISYDESQWNVLLVQMRAQVVSYLVIEICHRDMKPKAHIEMREMRN